MRREPERLLADVGVRIKELRRRHSLTQEQLAEQAGVSVGWIQQVESGTANLRLTTLGTIAALFDEDASALLRRPRTQKAKPGRPRNRPASKKR